MENKFKIIEFKEPGLYLGQTGEWFSFYYISSIGEYVVNMRGAGPYLKEDLGPIAYFGEMSYEQGKKLMSVLKYIRVKEDGLGDLFTYWNASNLDRITSEGH